MALCKKNIIIIQYELIPFFPPILEKILSFFKIKYILDIDDAIFLRYENKKNLLINFFLSLKFETLFNNASCVIAGNKYLAHKAKSMGQKNTQIIPTCVSLPDKKLKKKKKNFTVVWIGSPSTTKYIDILENIIRILTEKYNVFFRIIGSKNSKIQKNKNIEFLKWNLKNQDKLIQECHIGIMPLEHNEWEKGKCGYKILQYMKNALPVIVSRVGANKDIVSHNKNGFFVNSPNDWIKYIIKLKKNHKLSKKIGINGKKLILKKYNHQVYKDKFLKIVDRLNKN